MTPQQSPESPPGVPPDTEIVTAELVAKTIAGTAQIGVAHRVLEQAGHSARITGSRITVEGAIEAHLVGTNGTGWWHVHAIDGTPPVWTVGTLDRDIQTSWMGCVE